MDVGKCCGAERQGKCAEPEQLRARGRTLHSRAVHELFTRMVAGASAWCKKRCRCFPPADEN